MDPPAAKPVPPKPAPDMPPELLEPPPVVLVVEEPAVPNPEVDVDELVPLPESPLTPDDESPDSCDVRLEIWDALSEESPDNREVKLEIWEAFSDESPDNCDDRLDI